MSNAMRTGKRALAGVAAGALGVALLPIIAAPSASAAVSVTPGGPLRAATLSNSLSTSDSGAAGTAIVTPGVGQSFALDDTLTSLAVIAVPGITVEAGTSVDLTDAYALDDTSVTFAQMAELTADDSDAFVTNAATNRVMTANKVAGTWLDYYTGLPVTPTAINVPVAWSVEETAGSGYGPSTLTIFASTAGTYSFLVNGETTLSFTTTGAPATLEVDPTTADIVNVAGMTETFDASVKDSGGNLTQLLGNETLTLESDDDSLVLSSEDGNEGSADITLTDDSMATGTNEVTMEVLANAAGTAGGMGTSAEVTLAGGTGLSALTDASIAVTAVDTAETDGIAVSTPANAYEGSTSGAGDGSGTAASPYNWEVTPGVTTVAVTVDIAAEQDYNQAYIQAWDVNDDTATADATKAELVTFDSSGKATFAISVGVGDSLPDDTIVFYTGNEWLQVTYTNPVALFEAAPAANYVAAAYGSTNAWVVGAGTQYGSPLTGYTAKLTTSAGSRNPSKSITATTGADGTATLSLADASTSTTNVTDSVTIQVYLGGTFATNITSGNGGAGTTSFTATVKYSATGAVTMSDLTFAGQTPADYNDDEKYKVVPYQGVAAAQSTADDTTLLAVTAKASVAGTLVTFSGPSAMFFCETNQIQTIATTTDCEAGSASIASNSSTGVATVYVYATAIGAHEIKATSTSGSEVKGEVTYKTAPAAARDIAIAADPVKVTTGGASSITVTITDGFGNPVQIASTAGATDPSVTLATDLGSFGGGSNIYTILTTTTAGKATVTLTSPVAGLATVVASAAGTGSQFGNAALDPAPFAKSVNKATVPVEFTSAPTDKAIVITGDRTTVKGKPGIVVDGNTTGFSEGDLTVPYIKFPGETSYSAGTARPAIDADGEFYWQRKTGKKIYVYFTNEDGDVKSNRVIIPAK